MRKLVLLLASMVTVMLLASAVVAVGPIKQAEAVLPNDPGKIAFVGPLVSGGDVYDIHLANPDGSDRIGISRPDAQYNPTISPDGSKIAYQQHEFYSGTHWRSGIYVMNADGSGQDVRILDLGSTGLLAQSPSWAPSGDQIVFEAYKWGDPIAHRDIYLMNADGSGQLTNLTNTDQLTESHPTWSPDGQKIAFTSHYAYGTSEYNDNPTGDIYTINPDGSERKNITDSRERSEFSFPSWSPDGRKITYSAQRQADYNYDIYVMNADGSEPTNLTNTVTPGQAGDDEEHPSWSPDGKKIAFEGYAGNGNYDIYVMNSDGSNRTSITGNNSNYAHDSDEFDPRWGPSYGLSYDFSGFFSPVDNPDVLNRVKAGSAIPVKFSLGGDQGLDIFAKAADGSSFPKSGTMACDSTDPIDAIEQTVSASSSGLTYDAATDRYTYVWKTNRDWTGCRQLVVKLNDGKDYRANFKFVK